LSNLNKMATDKQNNKPKLGDTLRPLRSPTPTLQRIAEQSGVSISTISRILSGQAGRYRISKKTEAAVRALAKQVNFVPNQLARGLRLKKTLTIGLVIPDISNPFFAGIAQQVALGTHKHGYSVILCDSQDSIELEAQALALLQSRHIEGVVLCPVGQSAKHLSAFTNDGLPMVLVDRFFPGVAIPFVSSDNVAGARQATEFLIANGHRRIICLQGLRGTSPNEFRVQGYKEALAAHNIPVDESLIAGDSFTEESGYIETKLLLRTQPDARAILALSNVNALGAVRALVEEKRSVPEDMSIVSFDDPAYAPYLSPPMTTMRQSYSEMGTVAVKLLFDEIQFPRRQTTGGILLPTTMVVRQSVKKLEPVK
jgi:LacI family transcriptional regulator